MKNLHAQQSIPIHQSDFAEAGVLIRTAMQMFEGLYPPTGSLQSTKLRNGFVASLTELKRNGSLGSEFALRKSLFDDCKGEKFEELLFLFSRAVLQKVVFESKDMPEPPRKTMAFVLSTSKSLNETEKHVLQPLIIAYHGSIQTDLNLKHNEQVTFQELRRFLKEKENTTRERWRDVENMLLEQDDILSKSCIDVEVLKDQVRKTFVSSRKWVETILSNDIPKDLDHYLQADFANVCTGNPQVDEEEPSPSTSTLADLQGRLDKQQERLGVWRDFQKELSKRNELFIIRSTSKSLTKSPMKSPMKSPTKSPTKRYAKPQQAPGFNEAGSPSRNRKHPGALILSDKRFAAPKDTHATSSPSAEPQHRPGIPSLHATTSMSHSDTTTTHTSDSPSQVSVSRPSVLSRSKSTTAQVNQIERQEMRTPERLILPHDEGADYASVFKTRSRIRTSASWCSSRPWVGS